MNDHDLRALAAKLLKHYVVEDEAVAKIVETKTLERGEPKVVPLITAEERALLNMLGGPMAGAMECRVVSLAAQGCGCGCGCGCGDGDDDGESADAPSAPSTTDGPTADPSADPGPTTSNNPDPSTSVDPDAPSVNAAPASTSFDSWSAMMSALGVSAQDAPADPSTTAAPDSISISATQSASPDISNMTDAQLEAALNADVAAATAAANAAAASSATGTTTGVGTGAGALGGTAGGVAGGVEGGTGSGAGGIAGGLGDLAGGLAGGFGELFGISSAQAATPGAPMSPADVRRGAEAAAARGTLAAYLAQDPRRSEIINNKSWLDNLTGSYMSQLQATNNAVLGAQGQQAIYGSQPGQAKSGTGGASLGPGNAVATAPDIATQPVTTSAVAPTPGLFAGTYTAGSYTGAPAAPSSPSQVVASPAFSGPTSTLGVLEDENVSVLTDAEREALAQSQLTDANMANINANTSPISAAQQTALGSQQSTFGQTTGDKMGFAAPVTAAPAAQAPSSPVAAAPAAQAPSSPVAAAPAAPAPAPATPTTPLTVQVPTYTGIPAIDSRIDNAINNPGTTAINLGVGLIPGLGIANSLSGLLGGPTVGGALAGLASGATGAAPGSTADATGSGGGGDSSGGATRPLPATTGSQNINLGTYLSI